MPNVEFCRINRRMGDQSLQPRPFAEDMKALADSAKTAATVRGRRYIAADLQVDANDTFLTGLLGFAEEETLRQFEPEAFSWLKGEVQDIVGATSQMVVPFAVDLRDFRRWTAYVVSNRIRSSVFRSSLAATLNQAVGELGLLPSEWEVDPVASVDTVHEWVATHDQITTFTRLVRLTNPLVDVDEDRRLMRELGAREDRQTYTAPRGESLRLRDNDTFNELLTGMETGDIDVILVARAGLTGRNTYRSWVHSARTHVQPFGEDLERGIAEVLAVLQEFSDERGDVDHGDVA